MLKKTQHTSTLANNGSSLMKQLFYQNFTSNFVGYFQMLNANFDMNSAQYNEAPTPFIARYVRFVPKYWYNEICLRVEIYGCDGKM